MSCRGADVKQPLAYQRGRTYTLPMRSETHRATVCTMHHKILALSLTVCCCTLAAGTSFGAEKSLKSRVDDQNLLFEEYYQSELRVHPERATAYGDYRYNDRLDEYSLAALR